MFPLAAGLCFAALVLSWSTAGWSQSNQASPAPAREVGRLTASDQAVVDASVQSTIKDTGVPALSVAIVRNGRIVYLKAFGEARLDPHGRPAAIDTRFGVGSITKQFTAAAILLLADRGKLSLEDPVSKFLPNLKDGANISIRELLNHTSGYADYFTEEYIPAEKQRATTVDEILARFAHLDFEPGSKWEYSSTNYVIAGRIVEVVSGEPYFRFLQENILRPAGITDATNDSQQTDTRDALGYYRFGFGPAREAPRAGRNWLFAMADLHLTAQDLARWDITIINRSLLSDGAYRQMSTEARTRSGASTGYGLGVFLQSFTDPRGQRHTILQHPGEISGFRAVNYVVPDAKLAVVVLTNAEYSDASTQVAKRISALLGMAAPLPAPVENQKESRVRSLLEQLRNGNVDRTQLTPAATEVFTPLALSDFRESLLPLGRLRSVKLDYCERRGGMEHCAFNATYELRSFQISEYVRDDQKINQFMIDDVPR